MTPEDRTQKICDDLELYWGQKMFTKPNREMIATHLREYGSELEADRDRWADSACRLEKALEQADAEGYERGKKEIRDACSQHQHGQYAEGYKRGQDEWKSHADQLARQLAEQKLETIGLMGSIEHFQKAEGEGYRRGVEEMGEYADHSRYCIRSFQEAGEPTADGGYRTKFKGVWYQSRPVNQEPNCECGLDEIFKHIKEK